MVCESKMALGNPKLECERRKDHGTGEEII
jgi:hypothetical protein